MIDMTADAVSRLEHEAQALSQLASASTCIEEAGEHIAESDSKYGANAPGVNAVGILLYLMRERIQDRAREHARMIGWQVATYEIAALAREPANTEPIVWLTGNNYMPPLRSLDACEAVWQADSSGDLFEVLVDALEARLDELNVLLAMPDYDNALYVVDLERWEHIDEEDVPEGADSLNDEWRKRA